MTQLTLGVLLYEANLINDFLLRSKFIHQRPLKLYAFLPSQSSGNSGYSLVSYAAFSGMLVIKQFSVLKRTIFFFS